MPTFEYTLTPVSHSTAEDYPARSRDDTLQYFHGSTFKDTAAHTHAVTHTTEISDRNQRFPPARPADATASEEGFTFLLVLLG